MAAYPGAVDVLLQHYFPAQPHFSTLEERGVGLSEPMLAEALRKIRARRVVLIVDACQSGGEIESLAKIGEVKVDLEKRRAAFSSSKTSNRINAQVGFYLLAAATPVQEAIEPFPATVPKNLRHRLLTTALLETLQANASSDNHVL